ncbi:hypothetical protein GCM10011351_04970 [Paraliobacillus quinghaiensis]|uniref:Uncharacterized protein n=1 Tax=Paraliobacillus quinghaiensis TaxID=470815 RepID=A0A917TG21_9BACI|nr:hypothetical protein [Paraliobacillus quinghaiensis]GGM22088.1 hypothetical protein GCM10011351_04970 [Paraliobacillus quinghaiensis]
MTQQYLTIEEFNTLLKNWDGKKVKISKTELEDQDVTIMDLSSITYSNNTRRIDDYEPQHALRLNGSGEILTDENDLQPFPSDYYEIPLEDSTIYQYNNEQFFLITDRGNYTIELAQEN